MRIPRSYVEQYSRGLNRVSEQGRAALADALSAIDLTGDVAEARERVVAVMQVHCGASSTMAARLAADFYDGLRERFGIEDGFRAVVDGGYEPAATEGAVRAFAQDLVDGKPQEQFVGKCSDRLDREVRLSANQCVERNARRDPKKPRWARVPTGPETCEFCIMLASRGFVYHGEQLAIHAHANCDCRIVPSWDKAKAEVEGYDPNYYLDCYQNPDAHPEIREAINARRRELYAESAKSERKAAHRLAEEEEKERRRIAALSEEAKAVFENERFVETFGTATASRTEAAIDGAMKSGDVRRVNAAKLLAKDIADGFEVESVTAEGSKYLTGTGKVQFSPDGAQSPRTIAHELAHRRDDLSALSYTVRKLTGDVTLTTSSGSWSSMDFEHGNKTLAWRFRASRRGVTPAWRDLKRRLEATTDTEVMAKIYEANPDIADHPSDFAGLSDIIHAASNGKKRIWHGHFWLKDADGNVIRDGNGNKVPYWNDTTRVIETWADYSAALVSNGREAALIQQLFPEEAAIMDAMMEVMVS